MLLKRDDLLVEHEIRARHQRRFVGDQAIQRFGGDPGRRATVSMLVAAQPLSANSCPAAS
jgi:hypothetical protein